MTDRAPAEDEGAFAMQFGGGLIGSLGTSWVILGWIANGYPDGLSFLLAVGGAVFCFIGTGRLRILRARRLERPAPDEAI